MRRLAFFLFLVAFAAVAFGAPLPAPQPGPLHAGPLFTSGDANSTYPRYPELQIEVDIPPDSPDTVRTPGSFRLAIDQNSAVQATKVQSLKATNYGVSLVVCIDVSGSMKGAPLDAVRAGLAQYVSQAGPHDKMAVMTIANDSRWDTDFGDPPDKVRTALRGLSARGTLTRLWDSLLIAVNHFPVTPLSHRLVVISDGHDEGSSHTLDQVIAAAHDRSLVIDAIGVTRSNPVYLSNLARLAAQTGGTFRQAKDTNDLQRLVGNGIAEAQNTPVVTFRPSRPSADGRTHQFHVTWMHDGLQSHADLSGAIPAAPPWYRTNWVLIAGIALLLLLIILIIVLSSGRKGHRNTLPMPVSAVSPAASPAPAAAPMPGVVAAAPPAPARVRPGPTEVQGGPLRPRFPDPQRPAEPQKVSTPAPAPSQPAASLPPRRAQRTEMLYRFAAPEPGHPVAWLACEEGFAPGKQFAVDQPEYWIGAAENNHLRIADDPTVSGNHACLILDHDVLRVHDYHSTNGTRVNGESIGETKRVLRPGDRIRVGRSTFVLQPPPDGVPR
jgi:Mg-chelatase subunit ChlD